MSLPVFTTKVCRGWNSNTSPSANALTDCVTAAASTVLRARILPKTTTASLSGIMVKVGLFGLLWHSQKSGRLNFMYMSWRSFYIIFINKNYEFNIESKGITDDTRAVVNLYMQIQTWFMDCISFPLYRGVVTPDEEFHNFEFALREEGHLSYYTCFDTVFDKTVYFKGHLFI